MHVSRRLPRSRRTLAGLALGAVNVAAFGSLAAVGATAEPAVAAAPAGATTAGRYVLAARVALPGSVYSVAVVAQLNRIYVATSRYASNRDVETVEAIDLRTRRVVQRIVLPASGAKPQAITALAVDPTSRRVYVVISGFNQGGGPGGPNTLTVFNPAGRKIASTGVGRAPAGMALDPAAHRAYVANSYGGSVTVVNTTTNRAVRTIGLPHPSTLGPLLVDHATHRLVVAFDSTTGPTGRVAVINTTTARVLRVLSIGGNGNPYGTNERLALDPVLHQVWIGAYNVAAVRVLALHSLAVRTPLVATSRGIVGLAVDPVSRTLFVSLPTGGDNTSMSLDAVDLHTREPVGPAIVTFNGALADDPFNTGVIVYGQPNVQSQTGFLYLYAPHA